MFTEIFSSTPATSSWANRCVFLFQPVFLYLARMSSKNCHPLFICSRTWPQGLEIPNYPFGLMTNNGPKRRTRAKSRSTVGKQVYVSLKLIPTKQKIALNWNNIKYLQEDSLPHTPLGMPQPMQIVFGVRSTGMESPWKRRKSTTSCTLLPLP